MDGTLVKFYSPLYLWQICYSRLCTEDFLPRSSPIENCQVLDFYCNRLVQYRDAAEFFRFFFDNCHTNNFNHFRRRYT